MITIDFLKVGLSCPNASHWPQAPLLCLLLSLPHPSREKLQHWQQGASSSGIGPGGVVPLAGGLNSASPGQVFFFRFIFWKGKMLQKTEKEWRTWIYNTAWTFSQQSWYCCCAPTSRPLVNYRYVSIFPLLVCSLFALLWHMSSFSFHTTEVWPLFFLHLILYLSSRMFFVLPSNFWKLISVLSWKYKSTMTRMQG